MVSADVRVRIGPECREFRAINLTSLPSLPNERIGSQYLQNRGHPCGVTSSIPGPDEYTARLFNSSMVPNWHGEGP